jgi:hypothetical protein
LRPTTVFPCRTLFGMEENHNLKNLRAMARHLRLPAKWLRAEAQAGRIPHLRAGATYLFDTNAVEKAVLRLLRESAGQEGGSHVR